MARKKKIKEVKPIPQVSAMMARFNRNHRLLLLRRIRQVSNNHLMVSEHTTATVANPTNTAAQRSRQGGREMISQAQIQSRTIVQANGNIETMTTSGNEHQSLPQTNRLSANLASNSSISQPIIHTITAAAQSSIQSRSNVISQPNTQKKRRGRPRRSTTVDHRLPAFADQEAPDSSIHNMVINTLSETQHKRKHHLIRQIAYSYLLYYEILHYAPYINVEVL